MTDKIERLADGSEELVRQTKCIRDPACEQIVTRKSRIIRCSNKEIARWQDLKAAESEAIGRAAWIGLMLAIIGMFGLVAVFWTTVRLDWWIYAASVVAYLGAWGLLIWVIATRMGKTPVRVQQKKELLELAQKFSGSANTNFDNIGVYADLDPRSYPVPYMLFEHGQQIDQPETS